VGEAKSKSYQVTGGREQLELNFDRAYVYRVMAQYDVRGGPMYASKFFWTTEYPNAQCVFVLANESYVADSYWAERR
jgi:hypothetical protein